MKRKLRILVDMDNTIVDYSTPMAKALQDKHPEFPHPITVDNWSRHIDEQPHLKKAQERIQSQPKFFLDFEEIDCALDALREMEEEGHSVFIVSSPSVNNPTCHSDKSTWLWRHLGEKWARRLVLTKDKTIVAGDVLIDDRLDINGDEKEPTWKHIVFAQPYNVDLEGKDSRCFLHQWSNWKNIIEKVIKS
jgi:5'-nucleotidase